MRLSSLKIDPDFRDCLPKVSLEEYLQLEKNILAYGVQSPLIVWNGYIVDGHNRYSVCFNNNIQDAPVKEVDFASKEEAIRWILENQLGRRNLTDFGRNEIALRYKDVIAKRAKERQAAAGGDRKSENAKIGSGQMTTSDSDTGRTRTEIAKIAGTNDSSVKRTEFILKNGTEEEIGRARDGGTGNSQGAIYREIKTRITHPGMKICSSCLREKPLEEFRIDRSSKDGYASNCKVCSDESRARSAIKTKDAVKENDKEMSISQIKKQLKDKNAEISLSKKDIVAMVEANLANFVESVKGISSMDADTFNLCKAEVRAIIDSGINDLYEEVL